MIEEIYQEYHNAVYDADRDSALAAIQKGLHDNVDPEVLLTELIARCLTDIGNEVLLEKLTLSQHFIAARISDDATELVYKHLSQEIQYKGTIVLGTSAGDYHGLGRKIVGGCLKSHRFQVVDLGLNVKAEDFVEAATSNDAQIIGISSMMAHTALGDAGAIKVRSLLQERHLEGRIKIAVGGAPYCFDDNLYKRVGADAWAKNGIEAVSVLSDLLQEVI